MRLIGTFETEKEAYAFYSFLLKEGIQNIYEPYSEGKVDAKHFRIWVYDENDLTIAMQWLSRYQANPDDPQFRGLDLPKEVAPPSPGYAEISKSEDLKWQSIPSAKVQVRRVSITWTHVIIVLCSFLFFWNQVQEAQIFKDKGALAVEMAMTPLQQDLFFDLPSSYHYIAELIRTVPLNDYKEMKELPPEALALVKEAGETPSWKGVYTFIETLKAKGKRAALAMPLFEKIRQGEVWRFFTPCLMHGSFLHILFNMVWVWILSKQIEERMKKWKFCALVLVLGIVSNTAQYLVSGPYFLGFSGIIVGMAGFIWMRQQKAPWEGYPLQKGTLLFLLFFVLAMCAIELFTFGLQLFSLVQLTPNIANTAHVVGGAMGILLGRFSFFGRGAS
jgi:GlpG protein